MREASHPTIRLCLAYLAAFLVGVGSVSSAWATPMDAGLPPAGEAGLPPVGEAGLPPAGETGPLENEVQMDPGSVSVVDEEIELPEAFEGLLRAPPAGAVGKAQGRDGAADPEITAALGRETPTSGPGPMEQALFRHHLRLAQLMARNGDLESAAGSAGRAVEIAPDEPDARLELGFALLRLGRLAEAEVQLRRALELGSDTAPLHAALARTASAQHRLREAIQHGREALQRDPDLIPAANNLAWLLATSQDAGLRDPDESIRIAQRALRSVGGEDPRILDTLAAGYAAAGRFPDAVAAAERAETLARARGEDELVGEIRQHLERYRAGQAYTES